MNPDLKEASRSLVWSAKACELAGEETQPAARARNLRDAKEHAELALVEINKALQQDTTP